MKTAAKDFKMTELGPIPKDWEVKRLGDCCSKVNNGFAYDVGVRGKYAITRIETISKGWINLDRVGWCKDCPGDTYLLVPGDVLYSHINSLPYIGNCAQFRGGAILYHGMNLLLLRPNNSVDADYFFKVMSSEPLRRGARAIAKVAINQASINTHDLKEVCLALPPLPEQRKIAAALSDVDEMIAALEKLIEKKRKIKTGAMQRLLTGKTRLPGFKGAWVEKRLGEVGDVVTGSTPPRGVSECWGGDYNWISAKDFKGKYIVDSVEKITAKGKSFCRLLPAGAVLVTCIASIGLNAIAKKPCATNQQINAIICKACDHEFLYYQMDAAKDRMMELAGQTAVPIINKGDFEGLLVSFPPTLAEQKAIAKVLGDMDEEIAALEAELAKTRQLKQGMMQELLTGKVRLV